VQPGGASKPTLERTFNLMQAMQGNCILVRACVLQAACLPASVAAANPLPRCFALTLGRHADR
jgi:hypothetical protein